MANAIPAVGSRISLVSSGDIRYEGILYSIDMVESKIALQQGERSWQRGSTLGSQTQGEADFFGMFWLAWGWVTRRAEIRAARFFSSVSLDDVVIRILLRSIPLCGAQ